MTMCHPFRKASSASVISLACTSCRPWDLHPAHTSTATESLMAHHEDEAPKLQSNTIESVQQPEPCLSSRIIDGTSLQAEERAYLPICPFCGDSFLEGHMV